MSARNAVIRGLGLHKDYRRAAESVPALRGVDVEVADGEIVAISGASGSGKTTLLALLCGWEVADQGTVEHRAGPVGALPWAELAIVPQTLGLLEDLTVLENVQLPARLAGRNAYERAVELMQRFGLLHLADRLPTQTSLGEQQRCAVARALLLGPSLVLADEPTAHQDQHWAAVLLRAMREQAGTGGAFILVSHHAQTWEHADRTLTMADGQLS